MTDQDRILNMLAQGKISKEEAGELLEALDEADAYSLAKPEVTIIDIDPILPLPPRPATPELPIPPMPPALSQVEKDIRQVEKEIQYIEAKANQAEAKARQVEAKANQVEKRVEQKYRVEEDSQSVREDLLKMVQLTCHSGDVSIIGDQDLKEPQFDSEGKLKVQKLDDHNWVVVSHDDDVSVILPKNYGVVLVVDSGDVVLDGIAYVQGKASSGDLNAENIGKLDWVSDSGDIRLEHIGVFQGKISSGDVNIEHVETVDVVIDSGDLHIEDVEKVRAIITSGELSVEKAGLVDVVIDDGDITVNNAVMLRGKLTSGDLNMDHVSGLDFVVDSGDVNGNLLLDKGKHQLKVISGDVSLELLQGLSVHLSGQVHSGDINVNLPEVTRREGGYFEAKLAEGAATLNLNLTSGDLEIETNKSKRTQGNRRFKVLGQDVNINFDFDFDTSGFEGGKGFFGPKGVETPEGLKWIYVDSWSGDVQILSDASLSEPKPNKGSLQKTEKGDWKLLSLTDDLSLVLPAGYGVILSVKAGDVSVSNLPFIKGRVFAGDFTAKEVGGIDLFAAAGDIQAGLLITEGNHHLSAAAGNLSLTFLKGSNVNYQGSNGFAALSKFGLTKAHNGVVGEGVAKMTFRAFAGEVDIKVEA